MKCRGEWRTVRHYRQMRANMLALRACVAIQTIWRGRKARERARKGKRRLKGVGAKR